MNTWHKSLVALPAFLVVNGISGGKEVEIMEGERFPRRTTPGHVRPPLGRVGPPPEAVPLRRPAGPARRPRGKSPSIGLSFSRSVVDERDDAMERLSSRAPC
ncbi:hypothetical protein EVAR_77552_1 [Eumeta japonica]|uniref:Uncharacterized protein n=1 Tax=Eumeta variegata TaxID=151549 RepID=A0A4C1T9H3_EUMVA|nr:hypothetical protein EVAR_77552_1 [Eumeta japonica]